MYLYLLKEEERFAFLNLCSLLIKSSACPQEKQTAIINDYCHECNLFYIHYSDLSSAIDPETVFIHSDDTAKKIVLFEILSLAYSDDILEQGEQNLILNFAKRINYEKKYEEIKALAKEYASHINEISNFINK